MCCCRDLGEYQPPRNWTVAALDAATGAVLWHQHWPAGYALQYPGGVPTAVFSRRLTMGPLEGGAVKVFREASAGVTGDARHWRSFDPETGELIAEEVTVPGFSGLAPASLSWWPQGVYFAFRVDSAYTGHLPADQIKMRPGLREIEWAIPSGLYLDDLKFHEYDSLAWGTDDNATFRSAIDGDLCVIALATSIGSKPQNPNPFWTEFRHDDPPYRIVGYQGGRLAWSLVDHYGNWNPSRVAGFDAAAAAYLDAQGYGVPSLGVDVWYLRDLIASDGRLLSHWTGSASYISDGGFFTPGTGRTVFVSALCQHDPNTGHITAARPYPEQDLVAGDIVAWCNAGETPYTSPFHIYFGASQRPGIYGTLSCPGWNPLPDKNGDPVVTPAWRNFVKINADLTLTLLGEACTGFDASAFLMTADTDGYAITGDGLSGSGVVHRISGGAVAWAVPHWNNQVSFGESYAELRLFALAGADVVTQCSVDAFGLDKRLVRLAAADGSVVWQQHFRDVEGVSADASRIYLTNRTSAPLIAASVDPAPYDPPTQPPLLAAGTCTPNHPAA